MEPIASPCIQGYITVSAVSMISFPHLGSPIKKSKLSVHIVKGVLACVILVCIAVYPAKLSNKKLNSLNNQKNPTAPQRYFLWCFLACLYTLFP
jgi:hypothetical protein